MAGMCIDLSATSNLENILEDLSMGYPYFVISTAIQRGEGPRYSVLCNAAREDRRGR